MSRLISEILNAPEPSFSHLIRELELLAGRPGVDIKLLHEMKQLFKEKAKKLGLDENDTTVKEFYFGLSKRALDDSAKLAKLIGISDGDSSEEMADKSIEFVKKRIGKRNVWTLKTSAARAQLKENSPKKLMKVFGIRSIDSALKRESPALFYCFARKCESTAWSSKYISQASKLTNSDFDFEPMNISKLNSNRVKQLKKARYNLSQVTYVHYETASVLVAPLEKRYEGDVLFLVDSLFNHVKNILRISAYYRRQGFQADFFTKVELIRAGGLRSLETTEYPFSWNTLIHAASELGLTDLVSSEDANVIGEDFLAPSLAQLGQFDIWQHPFAIYSQPGITISTNLSDMIINSINRTPAEKAYIGYGRDSLKHELFARYLRHAPIQKKIVTG